MSRAIVRSAVAVFLAPPAVANLNFVHRSYPKRLLAPTRPGHKASVTKGAVAAVFIERESERRVAMGGATGGKKRVDYVVRLDVVWRGRYRDPELAMDGFDTLIDAIKTKLRSDRQLGNASIFQAGEQLLQGDYEEPTLQEDFVTVFGRIRFDATEFLSS